MAVLAFLAMAAACVFFLYVLVQFWMEEKHPRRRNDTPSGFPVISSSQIVTPLEMPHGKRRKYSVDQKTQGESEYRR
jgi:hypothetical protein